MSSKKEGNQLYFPLFLKKASLKRVLFITSKCKVSVFITLNIATILVYLKFLSVLNEAKYGKE